MTPEQFFRIYANTPLAGREIPIPELKGKDLNAVYFQLNQIQNIIRPYIVERDGILNKACKYFIKNNLI